MHNFRTKLAPSGPVDWLLWWSVTFVSLGFMPSCVEAEQMCCPVVCGGACSPVVNERMYSDVDTGSACLLCVWGWISAAGTGMVGASSSPTGGSCRFRAGMSQQAAYDCHKTPQSSPRGAPQLVRWFAASEGLMGLACQMVACSMIPTQG